MSVQYAPRGSDARSFETHSLGLDEPERYPSTLLCAPWILRSIFLNHILELELMNQEFILVAVINLDSPYLIWAGFKNIITFFISILFLLFFFWFLMNLNRWLFYFFDKLPQVFFYSEWHGLVAKHFLWFSSHFPMLFQVDHSWGNTRRMKSEVFELLSFEVVMASSLVVVFLVPKSASIFTFFFSFSAHNRAEFSICLKWQSIIVSVLIVTKFTNTNGFFLNSNPKSSQW